MRVSLLFSLLHEKETFKSLFVRAASLARVLRPPPREQQQQQQEEEEEEEEEDIYTYIYIERERESDGFLFE